MARPLAHRRAPSPAAALAVPPPPPPYGDMLRRSDMRTYGDMLRASVAAMMAEDKWQMGVLMRLRPRPDMELPGEVGDSSDGSTTAPGSPAQIDSPQQLGTAQRARRRGHDGRCHQTRSVRMACCEGHQCLTRQSSSGEHAHQETFEDRGRFEEVLDRAMCRSGGALGAATHLRRENMAGRDMGRSKSASGLDERQPWKSLICKHCNTNWFGVLTLAQARAHEVECGNLRCEHCCQKFGSPLELKGHFFVCDKHQDNRCTFCNLRFPKPGQKAGHEATCEQNPLLWCDWCGIRFQHSALRVKHQRHCVRHPAKYCPHCHQKFDSQVEAVVHAVFCHASKRSVAEPSTCAACAEDSQCIRFPCHEHAYCAQCLFMQVRLGLKDRMMFPLRCCRKEVQPGDAVDLAVAQMLPDVSREKYQETMLLKSSKDVMYCASPECGALIALDDVKQESRLSLEEGPHGCPKCQQALCFSCKTEWHVGMTCHQYQFLTQKNADAILKLCKDMNFMRCYECGHVVEKKHGCNHISCICGAHFCYLCGIKWGQCTCVLFGDGNNVPRHQRAGASMQVFSCEFCNQVYPSEKERRVHMNVCRARLDSMGGAFECSSCYDRSPTPEALRKHRKEACQVLTTGIYKCTRCEVVLEQASALRLPKRTCGVAVPGC